MTHILRISLILLVVCAASLGTGWLVGHAGPLPIPALFTNPDGTPCVRPCLFGIRPGETSYTTALALLRAHPVTRQFTPNLEGDILRGESMNVILSLDGNDQVAWIELANRPDSTSVPNGTSLGQVIALLGVPDWITDSSPSIQSYYNAGRTRFVHRHAQLGQLGLSDDFETVSVFSTAAQPPADSVPWPGFRAWSRSSDGAPG